MEFLHEGSETADERSNQMRTTHLAMLIALSFLVFTGCHWIGSGFHDDHDDGTTDDNQALEEYDRTVDEMKIELQGYSRTATETNTTNESAMNDYNVRMIHHLDRLESLRDQMSDQCDEGYASGSMTARGQCQSEDFGMTEMMEFEQNCRQELQRFMEICRNQDRDHEDHMGHVLEHVNRMNDLLEDMAEHCDEMMEEHDEEGDHDHDHHHDHHHGGHMM
jgi:hypothetical protein